MEELLIMFFMTLSFSIIPAVAYVFYSLTIRKNPEWEMISHIVSYSAFSLALVFFYFINPFGSMFTGQSHSLMNSDLAIPVSLIIIGVVGKIVADSIRKLN